MDSPASDAKIILKEYDTKTPLFQDFKSTCSRLIAELLRLEKISVHSVTARVKDRPKLEEKLARDGKNYTCLADITDVVGVRVITHFEDEIDRIGSLVEREFVVDPKKSVDKRKVLDPDRFGYLSLHYICGLSPDRVKLAEHRRFKNLVCEIQIRSILQHAWAEIEHDLGYKSGQGVPTAIRRRFSRLAGLLEVADEEFAAIRNDLQEYELKVRAEIETSPSEVGIDKISLRTLLDQPTLAREVDDELAQRIGAQLVEYDDIFPILSKSLLYFGISTIQQLTKALEEHRELLIYQAEVRMKDKFPTVARGIASIHLILLLSVLHMDDEAAARALSELGLGNLESLDPLLKSIREIAVRFKGQIRMGR